MSQFKFKAVIVCLLLTIPGITGCPSNSQNEPVDSKVEVTSQDDKSQDSPGSPAKEPLVATDPDPTLIATDPAPIPATEPTTITVATNPVVSNPVTTNEVPAPVTVTPVTSQTDVTPETPEAPQPESLTKLQRLGKIDWDKVLKYGTIVAVPVATMVEVSKAIQSGNVSLLYTILRNVLPPAANIVNGIEIPNLELPINPSVGDNSTWGGWIQNKISSIPYVGNYCGRFAEACLNKPGHVVKATAGKLAVKGIQMGALVLVAAPVVTQIIPALINHDIPTLSSSFYYTAPIGIMWATSGTRVGKWLNRLSQLGYIAGTACSAYNGIAKYCGFSSPNKSTAVSVQHPNLEDQYGECPYTPEPAAQSPELPALAADSQAEISDGICLAQNTTTPPVIVMNESGGIVPVNNTVEAPVNSTLSDEPKTFWRKYWKNLDWSLGLKKIIQGSEEKKNSALTVIGPDLQAKYSQCPIGDAPCAAAANSAAAPADSGAQVAVIYPSLEDKYAPKAVDPAPAQAPKLSYLASLWQKMTGTTENKNNSALVAAGPDLQKMYGPKPVLQPTAIDQGFTPANFDSAPAVHNNQVAVQYPSLEEKYAPVQAPAKTPQLSYLANLWQKMTGATENKNNSALTAAGPDLQKMYGPQPVMQPVAEIGFTPAHFDSAPAVQNNQVAVQYPSLAEKYGPKAVAQLPKQNFSVLPPALHGKPLGAADSLNTALTTQGPDLQKMYGPQPVMQAAAEIGFTPANLDSVPVVQNNQVAVQYPSLEEKYAPVQAPAKAPQLSYLANLWQKMTGATEGKNNTALTTAGPDLQNMYGPKPVAQPAEIGFTPANFDSVPAVQNNQVAVQYPSLAEKYSPKAQAPQFPKQNIPALPSVLNGKSGLAPAENLDTALTTQGPDLQKMYGPQPVVQPAAEIGFTPANFDSAPAVQNSQVALQYPSLEEKYAPKAPAPAKAPQLSYLANLWKKMTGAVEDKNNTALTTAGPDLQKMYGPQPTDDQGFTPANFDSVPAAQNNQVALQHPNLQEKYGTQITAAAEVLSKEETITPSVNEETNIPSVDDQKPIETSTPENTNPTPAPKGKRSYAERVKEKGIDPTLGLGKLFKKFLQ